MLTLSVIALFITYAILYNSQRGILAIDKIGIEFNIGFRKLKINWNDIENIEISNLIAKNGASRQFLGILLKNTKFIPVNLQKLLDINKAETGFHISFESKNFEEDIKTIEKSIRQFKEKILEEE